jgi:hypothetical protein
LDFGLYARVLWRFRVVVLVGLNVAAFLALSSVARFEFRDSVPHMVYKEPKLWRSDVRLLVTQPGFPVGRSIFSETTRAGEEEPVAEFADPARFTELAILYAHLAVSNDVRAIMRRDGPLLGKVEAAPVVAPLSGTPLPMFTISGIAAGPRRARALASQASRAFRSYLRSQGDKNAIPGSERVQVPVVEGPTRAIVVSSPSLARPVFVFLLVALLTIAVAFILENLKPQPRRPAAGAARRPLEDARQRLVADQDLPPPAAEVRPQRLG